LGRQVAPKEAGGTFTGRDMHQVERELHAAGRVGIMRAKLQEWDNCPEPEPLLRLFIQRGLDQVVRRRLGEGGVFHNLLKGVD
jgi:hypothetical protein